MCALTECISVAWDPIICAITECISVAWDPIMYALTECISTTWTHNKVRELIAVKVLHTSLLNTTMVACTVLPLGRYAPMPAPSQPFKTILELVLWNGLQTCRCLLISLMSSKCLPFNISFIFGNRKKSLVARSGE